MFFSIILHNKRYCKGLFFSKYQSEITANKKAEKISKKVLTNSIARVIMLNRIIKLKAMSNVA